MTYRNPKVYKCILGIIQSSGFTEKFFHFQFLGSVYLKFYLLPYLLHRSTDEHLASNILYVYTHTHTHTRLASNLLNITSITYIYKYILQVEYIFQYVHIYMLNIEVKSYNWLSVNLLIPLFTPFLNSLLHLPPLGKISRNGFLRHRR